MSGKHTNPRRLVTQTHEEFATQDLAAAKLGLNWTQLAKEALRVYTQSVFEEVQPVPARYIEKLEPGSLVSLVDEDGRTERARVISPLPEGRQIVQLVSRDEAHVIPCDEFQVWA